VLSQPGIAPLDGVHGGTAVPRQTKPKTTIKVKDLAPKSDAAKDVKGGVTGPCDRSRNSA
jgi:hypothetical protein